MEVTMARDPSYIVGVNDPEPGASRDNAARGTVSPLTRPLDAVIGGSAGIVVAVVVLVAGFAIIGSRINVPVVVILVVGALAFAASGAWTLAFGIRRWLWRKRNIARTGGVYLKPWERSPSPENRDWR
jgi:type IV secretory pathway VirB2 component (pilin)